MKNIAKGILLTATLFFTGCSDLDKPENEQVVGGELIVDLDADSIRKSLISAGVPGVDKDTTVYGYKAYKIPYTTTDEEGNSVKVSGLMVIPDGISQKMSKAGLSLISDSHGTIFANAEAPSVIAEETNAPAGSSVILTSLFAFVTLQADYIGFGDSIEHHHPFILKKSLADTTFDFIVAAKKFAKDNSINLNEQLFLTGYSEGGYAAMSTLEKIEMEGGPAVTMAAPMAGPYIMDGLALQVLSQDRLSVPSFMANIGYAYAKAYDEDIDSVINAPYASKLDDLFDGSRTRKEIDPELTTVTTGPDGLFKQSFVNGFFGGNWFTAAVVENSVYKWAPQTPVALVHCIGDDVIPFSIAAGTKTTMDAYGANSVDLVPVEIAVTKDMETELRYGHADCGPVAYGVTATIFANVRRATVGY